MDGQSTGIPASLSPLQQWAAQAHELYGALLDAGFDEAEALTLITGMTRRTD